MPQFTPSDRETVLERARSKTDIWEAAAHGPGIIAVYHASTDDKVRCYTQLAECHGWYVASYDTNNDGDVVVLMPFTGGE